MTEISATLEDLKHVERPGTHHIPIYQSGLEKIQSLVVDCCKLNQGAATTTAAVLDHC